MNARTRPGSRGQPSYIASSRGEFGRLAADSRSPALYPQSRGPSGETRCARDNRSRIFSPAGAWSEFAHAPRQIGKVAAQLLEAKTERKQALDLGG